MNTRIIWVLVACLLPLGCSSAPRVFEDKPVKVVVSFPPLYSFVTKVAGDRASVVSLCTTTGPHDYTYQPTDAIAMRQADIVFSLGFGLDDNFIDKAIRNSANTKLKERIVKLGNRLKAKVDAQREPAALILYGECDHPEHKGQKHAHADDIDVHMWSGIPQAKVMVGLIRDALKDIDPDGAADYDRNAAEYITVLDKIRSDGREELKNKHERSLVTYHASMAYFAETFNLRIIDTVRKLPTVNPTAQELADLVKACKAAGVKVIAVEPQYPKDGPIQALINALNREAKDKANAADKDAKEKPVAWLIKLDPLETAHKSELSPDWYENVMRKNIETLKEQLP